MRAIIARAKSSGVWGTNAPEREIRFSNTCLDEERRCPRITKCLVERNFGKLKRYEATMDVGERCC